jgi:UPF0271 protein
MVDINADLGEGIGNDKALMPLLSSCNIACGGHTGDIDTMTEAVELALKYEVHIGAHPSFPDTEHFGRKPMLMSNAELLTTVTNQIQQLITVIDTCGGALHHIKPHGALYNMAVNSPQIAAVIIEAYKQVNRPVFLYVPYQSVIADLAQTHGIPIYYEAFADRNYNADLSLVSRTHPNAIITDEDLVFRQVYSILTKGSVQTVTGENVPIKADTFCVHGDHPKAVALLKYLSLQLKAYNLK